MVKLTLIAAADASKRPLRLIDGAAAGAAGVEPGLEGVTGEARVGDADGASDGLIDGRGDGSS